MSRLKTGNLITATKFVKANNDDVYSCATTHSCHFQVQGTTNSCNGIWLFLATTCRQDLLSFPNPCPSLGVGAGQIYEECTM